MGYFDKLTAEKQVSYLIKPILEVLNQASTPLKTAEIRAEIIQLDTKIAEFANTEYTSKRTGNTYKKFTIKFGLALKELIVLDIVNRQNEDKTLVLTSKGRSLNLELLDVQKEIREKAQFYWREHRNKSQKQQSKEDDMNKEESRRICRAISNSEVSDFSWYKMKVGDIVTYKYESVDDSHIGEFGLGYNVNGGETEEQISSAVSCIFQVVDYTDVLDVSEKDTSKKRNASKQSIILKKAAVLRCVHVFNEPIAKASIDNWLDGSGPMNFQGSFICITDGKANKIIEKIKGLVPQLSTDIDNKNIILSELSDYKQEYPLQVMYYGAPGTGKSYRIASLIKKSYPGYTEYDDNPYVFRTTIYRDYSYYDFVGNIMPVTKEGKVSYEFVPGIFTTALCAALRTQDRNIDVYLILEEMSRGDIASIFGDIFQLLDRDETGKSMYGINNKSIYEYLILNGVIKAGHKIIIPSNLHIIGTVNTSDQNVNVIDTAFKRRFDFEYIGVDPIPVDGKDDEYVNNFDIQFTNSDTYEWVKLYQAINHIIINDLGLAEDKQLGPFFLKAKKDKDDKDDDDANHEQVANKLLHYLWQDVERVSYTGASLFDDSIKSFSQLYSTFKNKKNILSESVKQAYGNL